MWSLHSSEKPKVEFCRHSSEKPKAEICRRELSPFDFMSTVTPATISNSFRHADFKTMAPNDRPQEPESASPLGFEEPEPESASTLGYEEPGVKNTRNRDTERKREMRRDTEGWKSEGNSEMTGRNCGCFGKKGEVGEGERRTERDERNGEGEREANGMKRVIREGMEKGYGERRERERVWEGEWSGGMKVETDGKECESGWNRCERGLKDELKECKKREKRTMEVMEIATAM